MITVEPATVDTIEAMVSLHAASFAGGQERRWNYEDFNQALAMTGMTGLLLKDEGQWAAFYLFRQVVDEAEIILLGVDPAFQRQGYASQLLESGLEIMQKAGATKVFLEVREDNYMAIHFYEAHGFEKAGLRRAYYHLSNGQRKDAILYSLNIT